jgi:kumamolisin
MLVALLLPLLPGRAQTAGPDWVAFPGSHKDVAAAGAANPSTPLVTRALLTTDEADATLEVEVALRMRDLAGLKARLHRGEKIGPQELGAKYQPAAADYQAVTNWLVGQGLTITRTDPGRVAVFARGTVRQLAAAFQVTFARVASKGAEFTSAVTPPSLPAALAGAVLGVNGLQPHLRPHKHLLSAPKPLSTASSTLPPYWPRDILKAYGGGGLTVTGAGGTIGIIIDTFPLDSDLTSFWSMIGSPQSLTNMEFVQVVSGTLPAPSGEESLDVEWASGIASGARVRVYASKQLDYTYLDECYAQVYTDVSTGTQPALHQISMSYGNGEKEEASSQLETDEQYFAELSAVGVTVFASSGDGGSDPDNSLQVEAPASSTSVTGVGGTSLSLNATTGAVTSETVWNNGNGAGGGGVSIVFARPAWQVGTGVPAGSYRLVPDVALTADPNVGALVFLNGVAQEFGGTSWGSPSWAGFCALINQARANNGEGPIGLLGPNIYPLLLTPAFRDIINGNNGSYTAGVGYDECTGLGVPNLAALINALSNPPLLTSSTATQTVAPGANAVFTVVASGAPPLAFQWQRLPAGGTAWVGLTDNSTYSGSATSALTVAGATPAMMGDEFQCVVSNAYGSVTSPPAGLMVALPCLIQTIAGVAGTSGNANGAAASATFNFPNGIAEDSAGNIYLGDYKNNLIRKITPAGIVSTLAGSSSSGVVNATGTAAKFNEPAGVATDAAGNVYVADFGNNLIRKITPAGVVTTLAGSTTTRRGVVQGVAGNTNSSTGTLASFDGPADLSVDAAGNVYVADQVNNLVRKITPTGAVTTLAGSGAAGSADGTGTAASFNQPGGIGIDAAGNLYVADSNNQTIRKITMPGAVVTTLAGSPGVAGSADGLTGSAARFNYPGDVQPDAFGNLYVVDSSNNTLREILASGQVITVAGVAGTTGSTNGIGPAALFNGPGSIINEPAGAFAIADTTSNIVRRATQLVAPSVQISPGQLTVVATNNAVFAAVATGAPAPAFQWQRLPAGGTTWTGLTDNGTYSGSGTATLTVVGTTAAMNGDQFQCVVTNAAGTATSAPATLTVQTPPQIISAAGTAFLIGLPGSFTVTATGNPAPTFSVSGLPAWATLDPVSGLLAGTPPNGGGAPFVLTIIASNGAAPAASQSFTLAVQDTFAAWQSANFTTSQLASPGISGPTAVLGPDTSTNFLKYALGIAPSAAVPAGGQTVSVSGPVYTFTYTRPAAVTDVIYTVQVSTDLENWSSTGVTQQLLSTDATGIQTWQAQYPTTAPAAFFHLLVTQP